VIIAGAELPAAPVEGIGSVAAADPVDAPEIPTIEAALPAAAASAVTAGTASVIDVIPKRGILCATQNSSYLLGCSSLRNFGMTYLAN